MINYDEQYPVIENYLKNRGPIKLVPYKNINTGGSRGSESEIKKIFEEAHLQDALVNFLAVCSNYASQGIITESPKMRRTVGDLYRICLQHRPGTTLKEVYTALGSLVQDGMVASTICGGIRKRVYRTLYSQKMPFYTGNNTLGSRLDEFNANIGDFIPDQKLPDPTTNNPTITYEQVVFKND